MPVLIPFRHAAMRCEGNADLTMDDLYPNIDMLQSQLYAYCEKLQKFTNHIRGQILFRQNFQMVQSSDT